MPNEFFEPGAERSAKVNALFSLVAPRYDLMNDVQSFGLHRYWKRRLVRLSGARPGMRALDVCCGTGDIALALARKGVDATGVDFNERMLEVARKKLGTTQAETSPRDAAAAADQPPQFPRFVLGDAEHLPFPDDSFDVVTIGYGLRNLASWEGGLKEMQRVAKPGGKLLVLDFGKPDNALWRALYFGYLKLVVPCLGLVFCGSASAYGYILESLKHYPAQRGVDARMRVLNLTNVRLVSLMGGVMSINYGEKKGVRD